jgi:hypothetical protein
MTTFSDEYGTTTITDASRTTRKSFAELKAAGWRDMNRSGSHGEWRRDTLNTDTHAVTEVYSAATIRIIEWVAA